jgi:hypothetical protein
MPPVVGGPRSSMSLVRRQLLAQEAKRRFTPRLDGRFPAKGGLKLRKGRISRKMGFSVGVFIMLAREGGLVDRCYARPP